MTTITLFGLLAILALCHAAPTKLKRVSAHDQEQPVMIVCEEGIPLDFKRSSTSTPSQPTNPRSSNPATIEDDIQRANEHRTPPEDPYDLERAVNSQNGLHRFTEKLDPNDIQRALVDEFPVKAECRLVSAIPVATGPLGEGPGSRTYPKTKIPGRKPVLEEEEDPEEIAVNAGKGTNGPRKRPISARVTIFSKSQRRQDNLRKAINILKNNGSWNSAFAESFVDVVQIGSYTNGFRRFQVLFMVRFNDKYLDEVIM